MPDAWDLITTNSSLQTGDAWEHLNAQEGGGTIEYIFAVDTGLTMTEQTETITITDTDNITLSANDDTVTLTPIASSEYLTAQDSNETIENDY